MSSTPRSYPVETKRKPPTRTRRAQDLIEPVRRMIPTQWKNTRDTDVVSRYVGATRPSTSDAVLDDHEDRLLVIETRLGLRKPVGSDRGLTVVRRSA